MTDRLGSTAQRLSELPYEKRVCRIEHYPTSLKPPAGSSSVERVTMEEEINAIADAGTEVWVVHATRSRGIPLWPSKMLETPPDADPEHISRFLDLAHKKGIFVMTYYPFIFTRLLSKAKPEWMIQMLDDGGEEVWNEGWFCWNSPYRDWLPEYLNEMLDYFDFDGIYFDDMNWGSHSDAGQRRTGGCICSYCRDLYLKESGKELPTKVDMASLDFKRYINWRYEKFNEGVEHVAKGIYSRHPDVIIDWNYYGRPYGPHDIGWKSAHPLNPLPDTTHFFMEAGLENLGASFPAKLLKAAGPTFGIFYHGSQAAPEVGTAPYPEPMSATIYAISAVVKGGASITVSLDAGDHTIYGDALKSVFSEVKKLQPYVGGESVKHMALHVSQQTRDFRYHDDLDSFWTLLRGSHEMLKRAHVLTEVVFDQQLTYEKLSPFKVLFLSNSACLSDHQVDEIRRFVSEGGTLIATHETSLYDELGQQRDNFGLADVLGVDYQASDVQEMIKLDTGNVDPTESNIYVPQSEALRDEFGHAVAFGAKQSSISTRRGSELEVLFTKSNLRWEANQPPLQSFYAYANYDSGSPAVTINAFGKGKAIYVCGDVGDGYNRSPLPQLKRFVSHLARIAEPSIELEAPRVIELSAFNRKPGQLMIHLLNNPLPFVPWTTSREDRPKYFYIDELLSVHDVVIKLNDFKAKSASLPFQNRPLEVTNDPTTILVPKVHIEEVVLVELADE